MSCATGAQKSKRKEQDQIIRDTNSANGTARDHLGCWIHELIQNADDGVLLRDMRRFIGEFERRCER